MKCTVPCATVISSIKHLLLVDVMRWDLLQIRLFIEYRQIQLKVIDEFST